jgi:hypothetical protein
MFIGRNPLNVRLLTIQNSELRIQHFFPMLYFQMRFGMSNQANGQMGKWANEQMGLFADLQICSFVIRNPQLKSRISNSKWYYRCARLEPRFSGVGDVELNRRVVYRL